MAEEDTIHTDFTEIPPRVSEFQRFIRVFFRRKVVLFGMLVILGFIITAIFAPVLAPHSPYALDLNQCLLQPNKEHLLGTDALGRDTLSRITFGARTSLMVGIAVVGIATAIGMTLGLVAGYFGGWINTVIMRFIDAFMAIPMILLALVTAALLGGGIRNVIIALSIGLMPAYCRLMCGQVLTIKENDYVMAGRVVGGSHLHVMLQHVVPNCFPPLIVQLTMMLGAVILLEAALSFLGIGIEPPIAAWGSMINDGRQYLLTHPTLSFAPGLAIMLVVFAFNMVGDGLRDALDPRLRGSL